MIADHIEACLFAARYHKCIVGICQPSYNATQHLPQEAEYFRARLLKSVVHQLLIEI